MTAGEQWEKEQQLEAAAALLLGRMQFEFSRLDVAVGLCAVWIDNGQRLQTLMPKIGELTFHKKLAFIKQAVEDASAKIAEGAISYQKWLRDVDRIRLKRNELVHGRWGVDALNDKVINVIGLPTSVAQRTTAYSLAELEAHLQQLKVLQTDLSELRRRWPL